MWVSDSMLRKGRSSSSVSPFFFCFLATKRWTAFLQNRSSFESANHRLKPLKLWAEMNFSFKFWMLFCPSNKWRRQQIPPRYHPRLMFYQVNEPSRLRFLLVVLAKFLCRTFICSAWVTYSFLKHSLKLGLFWSRFKDANSTSRPGECCQLHANHMDWGWEGVPPHGKLRGCFQKTREGSRGTAWCFLIIAHQYFLVVFRESTNGKIYAIEHGIGSSVKNESIG